MQGSQVPSLPKFDLLDARNGKFYNYQGIPAFLRSEGPYSAYNHFKLKGEEVHDNSKLTKSNAKQRVHDQLAELRAKKETEKKLFYD